MKQNRRKYLLNMLSLCTLTPLASALSSVINSNMLSNKVYSNLGTTHGNNFFHIYNKENLKNDFFHFLINVFHLYPEKEFHQLIEKTTFLEKEDKKIYIHVQQSLKEIKPFLSELTYSIPALKKQKKVMLEQTVSLLDKGRPYNGYMEIGSNGRYYDLLEENIEILDKIYFVSDVRPGHSPIDIVDRGQISNPAEFIFMNNYRPLLEQIPNHSLDLITVYIGFHHCPLNLRENFFGKIAATMRKGGTLILRDHDVISEDLHKTVCLAHDVFNLGTNISWENNAKELRHFYSLDFIINELKSFGLQLNKRKLYQDGDPTKNVLMSFTKGQG